MTKQQYKKIKNTQNQINNAWRNSNPINLVINHNSWVEGYLINREQKKVLIECFRMYRSCKSSKHKKYFLNELERVFSVMVFSEPFIERPKFGLSKCVAAHQEVFNKKYIDNENLDIPF